MVYLLIVFYSLLFVLAAADTTFSVPATSSSTAVEVDPAPVALS
jgi:hypothetical protein